MNQRKHFILVAFLSFLTLFTYSAYAGTFLVSADSTVTIYRVQIASRSTDTEAAQIQQQLTDAGIPSVSVQSTQLHGWRVYAGPWPTRSEATSAREQIKLLGYPDALIVTMDISVDRATAMKLSLQGSLYQQALSSISPQIDAPGYSPYSIALATWSVATDTSGWLNAIPYFAQVLTHFSDASSDDNARFLLGKIYIKLYQHTHKQNHAMRIQYGQAAIDVLRDYVKKYPQSANAALALKTMGDYEHALSDYALPRLQRTAAIYKQVMDSYGNSSAAQAAHVEYAGILFEQTIGNTNTASWDTVQKEIASILNDTTHQVTYAQRARASLMYAETFFYVGDTARLIQSCRNLITQYGDLPYESGMGKYWLARATVDQGQFDVGLTQLQDIATTYSQSSEWYGPRLMSAVLFCQARAYEGLNTPTQAQALYQQIIQQYPDSWEAKVSVGRVNQ